MIQDTTNSVGSVRVIGQLLMIPLNQIRPFAGQPREYFDVEFQEIVESFKNNGQIIPVIVKVIPRENGHSYELVDGERRWRAAQAAGLTELKAVVGDSTTGLDQFQQSIISNLNRVNLNCLETARAILRFKQGGKTEDEILKIFGKKSVQWIAQHESLARLEPSVIKLLSPATPEDKRIAFHTALLLTSLPHEMQTGLATLISETSMTRIAASHAVKNMRASSNIKVRNRSGEEFKSTLSFFKRTNGQIEYLVDNTDERITKLFKGRSQEEIREMIGMVKDCLDNLQVVHRSFIEEFESESKKK